MSISRKINFGGTRVVTEQRANIFHNIEADICDFSRAQPLQNFAALKGNRQIAQLPDRKIEIGGIGELILDPVFFFGSDRRGTPDSPANVSSEILLQIRNDPPANPIAKRRQIFVRRVFAEFQSMLANIIVDFTPPDSKKRPNDCKIDIFNPAFRNFSDRAKTGRSGTAKQVYQKSFDQIVGVMPEKNVLCVTPFGNLRKEPVARCARGGFDRNFLFCRERSHACRSNFKIEMIFCRKFFDEPRIRVA